MVDVQFYNITNFHNNMKAIILTVIGSNNNYIFAILQNNLSVRKLHPCNPQIVSYKMYYRYFNCQIFGGGSLAEVDFCLIQRGNVQRSHKISVQKY